MEFCILLQLKYTKIFLEHFVNHLSNTLVFFTISNFCFVLKWVDGCSLYQVWSSCLHTMAFAIWWLMTLNIADLDMEGNTYHGVVLNDSQEHGKQSWIMLVHDISTSLSLQTISIHVVRMGTHPLNPIRCLIRL